MTVYCFWKTFVWGSVLPWERHEEGYLAYASAGIGSLVDLSCLRQGFEEEVLLSLRIFSTQF